MAAVKKSRFDRIFDGILYFILGFLALTYIYVLVYVVSASFSDPNAVYSGKVVLWPVNFTLQGYQRVFREKMLWYGYGNSLLYMIVGSVISTSCTDRKSVV